MRIYEDIDSLTGNPSGMVNFDDDNGNPILSEPKGTLEVRVSGTGIEIHSIIKKGAITPALAPTAIKDSTGVAYGATIATVRAALNRFFGDASTNSAFATDLWEAIGEGSNYFFNQKSVVGTYDNINVIANTLQLYPVQIKGLISDFGIRVATGTGQITFGIYSSGNDGKPDSLIWEKNESPVAPVNFVYSLSPKLRLDGIYWLALLSNAALTVYGYTGNVFNLMGYEFGRTRDYHRYTAAYTYATALPDPLPVLIPSDAAGTGSATLFYRKSKS